MSIVIENKSAIIVAKYRRLFDVVEQQLNGQKNHRLQLIRRWAMEQLEGMGFPHRKDEDYKYTYVTKIAKQSYVEGKLANVDKNVVEAFGFSNMDAYQLIFVNGILDKSLSKMDGLMKGLTICDLTSAYDKETTRNLVENALTSELGQNAFVALNTAFAQNGIFIHVAKNTIVDKPIHILNITVSDSEEAIFTNPQLLVVSEANSEVSVIETYDSINHGTYFTNAVTRFVVGQNAHAHHYKLQNESKQAFQINNVINTQGRDSTYSSYVIDVGGKTVRNNLGTTLKSSGTNTNLYGVYLANGNQHIDNQTFIDHAFPHCESNELYKGIIDDKGRGVFNGKVNVRPDAQKTNAYQQNSSLVLSNNAIMDSKPQLEIFADDVKCSHGATIGQLDEESIYYLRTRGMNLEQAKSVLQFAFVTEVLENFKLEGVREKAKGMVNTKLRK